MNHWKATPAFKWVARTLIGLMCFPQALLANPVGGQVVGGPAAVFQNVGNTLNVTTFGNTVINWQSFSNGTGEITRFIQPSAVNTVLNRDVGNLPSLLNGTLLSNGHIIIINRNGVAFGPNAQVDVAGLAVSSLGMSDDNFMKGKLIFDATTGAGSVINQGYIKVLPGGLVALVAPQVINSGIIEAPDGTIILAAGRSANLVDLTRPDLQVEINAADNQALNVGSLVGRNIGIYGGAVQQSGIVSANSASRDADGNIVFKAVGNTTLAAGSSTTATGANGGNITIQSGDTTLVSGVVEAKGTQNKGGTIKVLGNQVGLMSGASVDASGESGGGTVLMGGNYQGTGTEQQAKATYIDANATVKADALAQGDGGKVVAWSDGSTRVYGSLSARGGANGGNGGVIETSGHDLDVYGIHIDTSAPAGKMGMWLLDPTDVTINATGTTNMSGSSPFDTTGGPGAIIGWDTLNSAAASVVVQTTGFNSTQPGNITVAQAGGLTTSGASLTLNAGSAGAVIVNADINNTGGGDIILSGGTGLTNSGVGISLGANVTTTGNLSLINGTGVNQTAGVLTIGGTTLVNAGAGAIALGSANALTGAVSLNNSGANNVVLINNIATVLDTSSVGTGTLAVTSNGAITQTGTGIVQASGASTATFNAGANAITLNNGGNNFTGAVSLNNSGANAVSLTNSIATVLGASTVGTGLLTVTSNGALTQSGIITDGGTASFNAGANVITLGSANAITGAVSLNNSGLGNNVSFTNNIATVLGSSSVGSGTLAVTSNGAITQTGTGIVQAGSAGTASFNAGGNAITLTNAGNDFTGAVNLSNTGSNAVQVTDSNAIQLGTVSTANNLTVNAVGITQNVNGLTVGGTSTFNGGAGVITLGTAGNALTGAVSLNNSGGNAVSLTNNIATLLGTSSVGTGTLAVTSNGAITQTGSGIVQAGTAGTATFTAGANAITLTNTGNDFTGAVAFSNSGTNTVAVTDSNALILAAGTFGGNLNVIGNGALMQTGALSVAGTSSFNAGAGTLTLTNGTNAFTGAVSLNNSGGNAVSFNNNIATVLGTSSVGSGTLGITSNGAITQTGSIVQAGAGAASFNAGANAITLTNTSNDFQGCGEPEQHRQQCSDHRR